MTDTNNNNNNKNNNQIQGVELSQTLCLDYIL